ncbi:MAG: hypothetical protein WBA13_00410 [Microcoleaceae cyanobacterium]
MPSADFPLNQPQSESAESKSPSILPAAENQSEGEWQTVDFPNAISVDQLQVVDSTEQELLNSPTTQQSPSFLEIAPQIQPKTKPSVDDDENSTEFIQALREYNQDLVERIAQLEAQLDSYQKDLRDKEAIINQHTQELALAQEQVTRLFGKQELTHQVIQRQQVLVETLTGQWEASQTKMAQMERDCTLTQQRYNEQFHELMQTQNTCRDLRSRLHRQQRHTLQFKAALERAVEMQSRHRSQPNLNQSELMINSFTQLTPEPTLPKSVESDPTRQTPTPKASPVQPWSTQSTSEEKSVEALEEIIQGQEEEQFYPQPIEIVDQTTEPTTDYTSSPDLSAQLEELETHGYADLPTNTVESKPLDVSFDLKQDLSQAELLEEELERIQAEYASLNRDRQNEVDPELDLLEYVPKAMSEEISQSVVTDRQPPQQADSPPQQAAHSNWPAPLIQPPGRRKLQSIAAIKLPKLPKTVHWTPESESPSTQEWTETEPF